MKDIIYIIEDDEGIRDLYECALSQQYELKMFSNGHDFFEQYQMTAPDMLIIDIMLPDMDGYEILTRVRSNDERIPILMVSAKTDEMSSVKGLTKGADDYITKPFSVMDLLARVKACLRRAKLYVKTQSAFTIDNANYQIFYKDTNLNLTLKEFRIMRFMLSNADRTLSREELFRELWGDENYVESRALDMHIAELREKLRLVGAQDVIKTVRGIGYKLNL